MAREIYASDEQQLEKESQLAIDRLLIPWRITWVDGRDDFGRDGFIQLVTTSESSGKKIASPLTCAIQAKSHAHSFANTTGESLEVRHLQLWSEPVAVPTIIAVWSRADDAVRVRTAREVVAELDSLQPHWRNQGTVTVHFDQSRHCSQTSLEQIAKRIHDESDRDGGATSFHTAVRRVMLTDVYFGTTASSFTFGFGEDFKCMTGPGWMKGDLDPIDVLASRVLVNALLLFDQVWIPLQFFPFAAAALPGEEQWGDKPFYNVFTGDDGRKDEGDPHSVV